MESSSYLEKGQFFPEKSTVIATPKNRSKIEPLPGEGAKYRHSRTL